MTGCMQILLLAVLLMQPGDENRRRFYFGNLDTYRMAANNAFQQDFAVKKTFMPMDPYDNQSGEMECGTKGFEETK